MSYYSELLKSPLWQRRRLEIMQQDGWRCRICGADDKQLHVHHIWYDSARKPWEYHDTELRTYCGDCHKAIHNLQEAFRREEQDTRRGPTKPIRFAGAY